MEAGECFSFTIATLLFATTGYFVGSTFTSDGARGSIDLLVATISLLVGSVLLAFVYGGNNTTTKVVCSIFMASFPCLIPFRPRVNSGVLVFVQVILKLVFVAMFSYTFARSGGAGGHAFLDEGVYSISTIFTITTIYIYMVFFYNVLPIRPITITAKDVRPRVGINSIMVISGASEGLSRNSVVRFGGSNGAMVRQVISGEVMGSDVRCVAGNSTGGTTSVKCIASFSVVKGISTAMPGVNDFSL